MADTIPLNPANPFCQGQPTGSPGRTRRRNLPQRERSPSLASAHVHLNSLRVVELRWQNCAKRVFLGSAGKRQSEFVKVRRKVCVAGEAAESWGDFLLRCLQIFRKHGFIRVEP